MINAQSKDWAFFNNVWNINAGGERDIGGQGERNKHD
jgi:hypothetical protein